MQPNPLPDHTLPIWHRCSACGVWHPIHPLRHRMAYGRVLACSAHCRVRLIQKLRQKIQQRP